MVILAKGGGIKSKGGEDLEGQGKFLQLDLNYFFKGGDMNSC